MSGEETLVREPLTIIANLSKDLDLGTYRDALVQVGHVGIGHADTPVLSRCADESLLGCAVDVDVTPVTVHLASLVDPRLHPAQAEDAGGDEVLSRRDLFQARRDDLPCIDTGDEHPAQGNTVAVFFDYLMEAYRGAVRPFLASGAVPRGRAGIAPHRVRSLVQSEPLGGDLDDDAHHFRQKFR